MTSTDLLTTSFQPSSLFWLLLGLVRLSLLLGEVTGKAIVLNGDGKELEVEIESMVSETLKRQEECWVKMERKGEAMTNHLFWICSIGA